MRSQDSVVPAIPLNSSLTARSGDPTSNNWAVFFTSIGVPLGIRPTSPRMAPEPVFRHLADPGALGIHPTSPRRCACRMRAVCLLSSGVMRRQLPQTGANTRLSRNDRRRVQPHGGWGSRENLRVSASRFANRPRGTLRTPLGMI